jgi:hypothetical protein
LLKASFIAPLGQRELPELTRYRSRVIRERVNWVNRVHKVLEGANLKLASVASDGMGVSGRAMLAALIDGQTDPDTLADLAKGRLRDKREQLVLQGKIGLDKGKAGYLGRFISSEKRKKACPGQL